MRHLLAALVALPLLSGCASIFDGDARHEPTALRDFAVKSSLRVQWQVSAPAADGGLFSPAYDQGKLWVAGGNGKIAAFDVLSGRQVAGFDLDQRLSAGVAVAGNLVFVGTADGKLLAVNSSDGKQVWSKDLTSYAAEPPVVGGNALVVRSNDGRLTAFEPQTGRQLWTDSEVMPALVVRQTTPQIRVEGDDVLMVGGSAGKLSIYALEQGRMLWQSVVASPRGASELERVTDVVSQPVFDGRRVCAVAYQSRVACFEARGGQQIWSREVGSSRGLSIGATAVYVTADNGVVWSFDLDSGRNLWKQDALQYRAPGAPVQLGDNLMVVDGEGYAHLLSPLDGQIVGRSKLKSDGVVAKPLAMGKVAYVLDASGSLSALTN